MARMTSWLDKLYEEIDDKKDTLIRVLEFLKSVQYTFDDQESYEKCQELIREIEVELDG